ncbi:unnamed protein product [Mytilus coruscus]|uniref:DNA-directed DNA polymerase n=1 Tax=Mytilus coruscus TaxID=42192 RepID=A0A6J8DXJ9_MYTCO|nr:unnamed protein product [Mytilus coruscus]
MMIYCNVIVDIKPPHRRKKCIHCKQSWCGTRKHTPNLCVYHKVCEECMSKEVGSSTRCQKCGQNEYIFRGETARDDFCRWLFSEANRGAEVLCHNCKGYDSYPFVQYLYQNGVLPEVIKKRDGIDITHARNRGEKQIGPFLADGYHEILDGEKIVYEFHGCFWHACPECFAMSTMNPVTCTSMFDLYQRTVDKRSFLEKKGNKYIFIWECEFDKEVGSNTDLNKFVKSHAMHYPLEPREAFYGGRTEAFTMYKEAAKDESINYYDVTSLYPFINKTGKIPLGQTKIITEKSKM